MYKTLSEMGVPVPRVYVADADGRGLGRPFLLIQKLEDERLRSLIKSSAGGDTIQAPASALHRLHSVDHSSSDFGVPRKMLRDEVSEVRILTGMLLTLSVAPVCLHRVQRALQNLKRTCSKQSDGSASR